MTIHERLFDILHQDAPSATLARQAIGAFREEVNDRAEAEMLKTGNISGAHHRAIESVWKELQQ